VIKFKGEAGNALSTIAGDASPANYFFSKK
jgi:hypothetical protein